MDRQRAKRLKRTYAGLLRSIKDAIDREDIEGLLASGSPADEYEPEAERIAAGLGRLRREGKAISTDAIVRMIHEVWQEMFGPFRPEEIAAREPAFRRIATRLSQGES